MKKTITKEQLKEILVNLKGNTFATITTKTEPAQKSDSPFKNSLKKLSRVNVCIGFHYTNSVQNQEKREGMEGTFQAKPRKWGQRIEGTPLVEHKGKFYLETKVERSMGQIYLVDDKIKTKDKVNPFLKELTKPATQDHLKKFVILRDFSLDNIKRIRYNGNVLNIV